jgi:STE24 endopeptidase
MKNDNVKRYNIIKLKITLSEVILSLLFWSIILKVGLNYSLSELILTVSGSIYIQFYLFCAILGGLNFFITFPLSFYGGFVLEKKFRLSNHTLGSWFIEQIKGMTIAILLALIVLSVFFFLLRTFPNFWWLNLWIFFLLFGILLTRIAPILIFPLFYKFSKIDNKDLEEDLFHFAKRYNFHISGIYQFNLSKTTQKANAAFTGIGKSRRVILGDTLLRNFSIPEILTIFAHEIGHYIHKHLIKGIIFNSLISLIGMFLVFKIYTLITDAQNLFPQQLVALPYLALLFLIYSLVTGPVGNYISRKFEYQADQFAVESTKDAESFLNSLKKLSNLNLADPEPHPLVEFLFYSHPSINHRILKLTGDKK